ncbi:MAG: hypothetical protein ACXWAT_16260, partial [Methylobacter sp.]
MNGEIVSIHWETSPYYHGAFKLQLPGQDTNVHTIYFQFLSALDPKTDRGVYLAGDSVSWSRGWVKGAFAYLYQRCRSGREASGWRSRLQLASGATGWALPVSIVIKENRIVFRWSLML